MSQNWTNATITGTLNLGNLVSMTADNASSQTSFKDTLQTVPDQSQDRNIIFRATNLSTNAHNLEFDNFSGVHMPRNLHVGGALAVAKNIDNKGQSYDMADFNKGAMKVKFVIDRNGATQTGNKVRFEVDNDQYKADQLPLPIAFGGNKQPDTMTINTWRNEVLVNGQLSATGMNSTNHHTLRQTFQNRAGNEMMEAFSISSNNSDATTQRLSFESAKFGQSAELQHAAAGATLHWEPQGLKESHSLVRMGAQQFDLGFRKQGADEVLNLDLPAMPGAAAGGAAGSRLFQISTGGTPAVVVRPRPASADGHEVEVRGKLTAKQVVAESVSFTGDMTMDNKRKIVFRDGAQSSSIAQEGEDLDIRSRNARLTIGQGGDRITMHPGTQMWMNGKNVKTRFLPLDNELQIENETGSRIFIGRDDIKIGAKSVNQFSADGTNLVLGAPDSIGIDAEKNARLIAKTGELKTSGLNNEVHAQNNININSGAEVGINNPGTFHVNTRTATHLNSSRTIIAGRGAIGGHKVLDYNDDAKADGVLMKAFAKAAPSLTIQENAPIIFQSSQPYNDRNRAVVLRSGRLDHAYYQQFGTPMVGLVRSGTADNLDWNANTKDANIRRMHGQVEQPPEQGVGGLQMFVDENLEFNIIGISPAHERTISGGNTKAVVSAHQLAKFRMDLDGNDWRPTAYMSRVMWGSAGTYSDKRLKENIKDIDDEELEKLDDLAAVKYNPKEHPSDTKYGFIAQDVEKLYPHLVSTGLNDMKAVDYTQFIPLLAKANTKLREELEETKERIKKLERGNML